MEYQAGASLILFLILMMPFYDNNPPARYAIPGCGGHTCVFRLSGNYGNARSIGLIRETETTKWSVEFGEMDSTRIGLGTAIHSQLEAPFWSARVHVHSGNVALETVS